jgi:hypothetical protein
MEAGLPDRRPDSDRTAATDLADARRLAEAWSAGYLTAAREVADLLDPSVAERRRRGLGRLLRTLMGL